jgi:hypothetical protein
MNRENFNVFKLFISEPVFYILTILLLFPFLKLIQINIILSDNVHILYIYTCLNQTLNKPESCINLTLNQDSMHIGICIHRHVACLSRGQFLIKFVCSLYFGYTVKSVRSNTWVFRHHVTSDKNFRSQNISLTFFV